MSTADRRRPGRPRKLPPEELRELVLSAARTEFAAHGQRSATIEQIARAAGVSRQSVYETFGDRSALFAAVVAEVEELAVEWMGAQALGNDEPDLRMWARANFGAIFDFVEEYPDALPVLQEAERGGDPAMTRVRSQLAGLYTEASRKRWAEHGIDPGRTDTALAAMYIAMTEALVKLTADGDPPEREALVELLTEFTIGGVQRLYQHGAHIIERMR
ncbi:transcriptional regulator, TetR family [Amycolatopsis marina]|uniref:Transcriptional regulator, TetR family n=1 Tax=Amycolatopsis marina TaxID=490629 RepID=A0A1I0VIV9_9PSEU|nr:TetR/AcrR family transcriptional regulator [Amycolatopsis marina]SFA76261.1 transcriptional regulator, TetR family [Amycolatopsis marina]